MNNREQKRHKREVSRANSHVKLSAPDVRTPEQIKAAREASRPVGGWRQDPHANFSGPSMQNHVGSVARSPSKADG